MARALRPAACALAAALAAGACSIEAQATRNYVTLTELVRASGGMRTDYNPPDAPWGARELAANLERIAFFTEFAVTEDGALRPQERPTRLLKWTGPIRYRLVGDAVTDGDRATYARLARRLAAITGLSITAAQGEDPGNLLVMIMSRDARRRAAAFLDAAGPTSRSGLVFRLREDDYAIPCAASLRTGGDDPAIVWGVILIKAETSGLLRESCAHEEFAQVLGPGNDSPDARPSIFNDDQEFATLTYHDAALLRVLYDPALRPGMTREEGMVAARRVIARLGVDPPGDGG